MREDILALGERIAEQCVHLDAAMHRLLRDLHTFDQAGGWYQQGFQSCAHWLSWRVGWSLATARDRVRVANRLPALPKVAAKLESGELSYSKARAIARVATPEIEEALLVYAKHLPAAQLERVCGKVNMVMETRQAIQEGKPRARHERSVQVRPLEDGMACVTAVLTADEAALLMNVIEEVAHAQQKPAVEAAAQANAAVRPSRRLPRADGLMTVVQAYARGASPDRTPIDLLITVPVDALQGVPTRTRGFADSAGSAAFANSRRDDGCGDSAESAEAGCANGWGVGCDGRCGDSAESAEWSGNGDHSAELEMGGMTCVGELPNGTALAPPTLRRLACDAGLVEVSVDVRGKPLSVGRKC